MATQKLQIPESCSPLGLLIPKSNRLGTATFGTLQYYNISLRKWRILSGSNLVSCSESLK